MDIVVNNIKDLIVRTPLLIKAKEIEASILNFRLSKNNKEIKKHRTFYCISPYKTGTTYLSTCYNKKNVKHEPLSYFTLKKLDKNFDDFFIRRLNTLNLKLECSGFWSGYIEELANGRISKELDYICIIRPPSKWITSIINYFSEVNKYLYFDHVNEFFLKRKVGVDLQSFMKSSEEEKNEMIEKLIDFYFDFTRKTKLLKNMHYVYLHEIDGFLDTLDTMIQEQSLAHRGDKNKMSKDNRLFEYANPDLDREYEILISRLLEEQRLAKS